VRRSLAVTPPQDGTLIQFGVTSRSPALAAQIANGFAEAFVNSNLQRKFEASAYARTFLQRQIAKTRADLENSERRLVAYAQAQGIINTGGTGGEDGAAPGDTSSPQGESLLALNKALADATARRVSAEGAYRAAQASGITAEQAASTQALRQARAALEAEYQDKRTVMKAEHPEMISLRSRIDELNRQIARETADVSAGRSNTLLADYRAALAAERSLQARVAQLKGAVLDLRGRSIQYAILQRDVDTNRSLYDALLQRYKEIGVAGGIGTSPVSIVDRAEVPSAPFKPNLFFNVMAGLAAGLVGGLGLAFALEMLTDTIRTREDVRTKLGLPCLGAIPKQGRREEFIGALEDPGSSVSEGYSDVVASLRFSTEAGVPKALLVTSSRPSEGKSSTALAIALNFARRGNSVLLVDADLRKPAFKAPTESRSLTKLLTSEESVADHLLYTQYENLWLLPAGPIPPNPADLLATKRFGQILNEVSGRFDVIIIDAPPVLGMADVLLMLDACEDVLLVVEAGKTRTAVARDMISRLRTGNAHILGVTLAKATDLASSYGYGDGYGYGRYGAIKGRRENIIMIAQQPDESEQ
jgi:capsular exopolysaccharide synthesis family protein